MKKSLLNQKFDDALSTVPRINRERVFKAFKEFGYSEDFKNSNVTVLRQTDFPFHRITIPNLKDLSVELIKMYLTDLRIDLKAFLRIVKNH